MIIGTLPGILVRAIVQIKCLPDQKNFKLFAGLGLLYMGGNLSKELVLKKEKKARPRLKSGSSCGTGPLLDQA